jgi:hypothetical protein
MDKTYGNPGAAAAAVKCGKPERNAAMCRLRDGGLTYAAIGRAMGVGERRARMIVMRDCPESGTGRGSWRYRPTGGA